MSGNIEKRIEQLEAELGRPTRARRAAALEEARRDEAAGERAALVVDPYAEPGGTP